MANSSQDSNNLATAKTILSTVGTVVATAMVVRTLVQDYFPPEFQEYIFSGIRNIFNRFSPELTMVIDEFDGLVSNEIYEAAEVYLGPKITPKTRRLKISRPEKEKNFNISMEKNQEVVDLYKGVKLKWQWICNRFESKHFYNPRDMNSTLKSEVRSFELTFNKKYKDLVINSYLPHVINEANSLKQEKKTIKIYTVDYHRGDGWTPVNLDHPAKFETLAMDGDQKDMILKDIEKFVERREFYRKVGKAWKRGYLLYGPPGTGKSSLIAAMANHLNFDIYDLELTGLRRNSELRSLLVATANKSILVVEDIDATIDLNNKLAKRSEDHAQEESKVTLSGLLNFIDGLWSSCGDERIIIFTTNHIEKLDPALLRPGRMDVHIYMSYCTPGGFRLLAANYLGIKEHELFMDVEQLIDAAKVTPAEVAEQLLKGHDEQVVTLKGLIHFLQDKQKENVEAITKNEDETNKERTEQINNKENQAENKDIPTNES
ncbi:hypothetical protein Leryth_020652 [Lithospermum erythrorhizon]|nr:hypothetical protein Leryth_020652 [Lithospermum erythrorhizon]